MKEFVLEHGILFVALDDDVIFMTYNPMIGESKKVRIECDDEVGAALVYQQFNDTLARLYEKEIKELHEPIV